MRIIESIVVAVLRFLLGEARSGRTAVDADRDRGLLRRGGDRIRRWMRPHRARPGVEPDPDRTGMPEPRVRDDWERVEARRE